MTEIVSVEIEGRKETITCVSVDEHPRPDTTPWSSWQKLKPVFRNNGTVTAGNSSGLNDGSCAIADHVGGAQHSS